DTFPSLEAQAGAISDDIAYDSHDLDDGLRAELFTLDELAALPLAGDILAEVGAAYPGLEPARRTSELSRRMITRMIEDVAGETRRRLAELAPDSADAVRCAGAPMVGFSKPMAAAERAVKKFLFERMYRHERVMHIMGDAEGVLRDLFARYIENPEALPAEWRHTLPAEARARARHVADFIAGMTDRYALSEHRRLFDLTPLLR
ncbi:MAG: deoxyguanosinetriphosphate triphosphohydrolase, partial [Bradyrhizobiaceae bacterium]|nr:deoxyguanosinetriphosphate triphosphohydrolase [Bradyrhizobiaceae bacterium]